MIGTGVAGGGQGNKNLMPSLLIFQQSTTAIVFHIVRVCENS